jgi:uncharacterized membrane protein YcjF (UPF0283 family)
MEKLEIGKMTISQVLPHLKQIADLYKLRLNHIGEFKLARLILINLYATELTYEYLHDQSLEITD